VTRRLIIKEDPATASNYIADYIIGEKASFFTLDRHVDRVE